jgi:hypothetical protein
MYAPRHAQYRVDEAVHTITLCKIKKERDMNINLSFGFSLLADAPVVLVDSFACCVRVREIWRAYVHMSAMVALFAGSIDEKNGPRESNPCSL